MTHRGSFQPLPFCDSVILWDASRGVWPAGRGRFSFPSTLPPSEASSGVLCPVLSSPVQEWWRATGQSPAEGYKVGERTGPSLLWEEAEGAKKKKQKIGLDDPQRSLPTPTILSWACSAWRREGCEGTL